MHQFLWIYSNAERFYVILFSRQIWTSRWIQTFFFFPLKLIILPAMRFFWLQPVFCWKEPSSFHRSCTINLCNELFWFIAFTWYYYFTSFISSMDQVNCSHEFFSLSFHNLRAIFLNVIESPVGYRIHTYKSIGLLPGSDLQLSSRFHGRSFE